MSSCVKLALYGERGNGENASKYFIVLSQGQRCGDSQFECYAYGTKEDLAKYRAEDFNEDEMQSDPEDFEELDENDQEDMQCKAYWQVGYKHPLYRA